MDVLIPIVIFSFIGLAIVALFSAIGPWVQGEWAAKPGYSGLGDNVYVHYRPRWPKFWYDLVFAFSYKHYAKRYAPNGYDHRYNTSIIGDTIRARNEDPHYAEIRAKINA